MEQGLFCPIKTGKSNKIFNNLLVILLAALLVLPNNCLAKNSIDGLTLEEIEKNLELSNEDAQEIMNTLRQSLTTELINLWSSSYATDNEIAVAAIMLKAAKIEEVSYFFKDAPLEAAKGIIKGAIEVAQIVLAKNLSEVLGKLEQKTVKMAIDYGMKALIDNEIKISTGAIKLKYYSYKNQEKEVLFQYVIVSHYLGPGQAKIEIRFYSPDPIEAPSASKFRNGYSLSIPDIRKELPPFIVDITGTVGKDMFDDYQWIGGSGPLIKIEFPQTVPDFGIKPPTLFDKQILNPIESTIKEFEVIISKTTGKAPGITDIWNEVKSFISKFSAFSPASITGDKTNSYSQSEFSNISNIVDQKPEKLSADYAKKEDSEDAQNQKTEKSIKNNSENKLTAEEIQEIIDDISEKIDALEQKIFKITGVESELKKDNLKIKKAVSEQEEGEEDSDFPVQESGKNQQEKPIACDKKGGFAKNQVIFNEIAWMGTKNSASDEWIELKNLSGNPVDLSGWQILNKENQIKIFFTNEVIPGNGFLLLERTDDNSVSNIAADLIYSGSLNNTNEYLYLFDKDCQLQDEVIASPNWPAGDNSSKRTMERKINLSWQSSSGLTGTPKRENSSGYYEYAISGGGGTVLLPQSTPNPSSKIIISEIQIASASNESDEFIELYNPNDWDVDISQWSIQKSYSTSTSVYKKNFEKDNIIPAKGYFLIANASSTDQALLSSAIITHKVFSISLNNSIYLVKDQKEIENATDTDVVDLVGFGNNVFSEKDPTKNPSAGKSIGRKWSTTSQSYFDYDDNESDFEIQDPTPNKENISPNQALDPGTEPSTPYFNVVINEIAWMGTGSADPNDEWIELYNNSSTSIDLTGWKINKNGQEFISIPTSTIHGFGFYLLERTSRDTTDIAEDNIYTGSLNNDGEKLELINSENILIDEIDCSGGWFAGTSSPFYISMERIDPNISGSRSNWQNNNLVIRNGRTANGQIINGTPGIKNSVSMSSTTFIGLPFEEFSEITLTYHGSPYIVNNRLPVPKDKTLRIEEGVILKFPKMSGIEVRGKIEAIGGGEEEKKIVFTSLKDDSYGGDNNGDGPSVPYPGDWDWIYFQESFGSVIKNSIFKYGSAIYGCFPCCACQTKGMINVEGGEVTIEDSLIEKSQTIGLWLINSSTTVNNVSFLDTVGVPVDTFEPTAGLYIQGGNPVIKNSYFSGNKYGIKIISEATPIIENNIFQNNITPIYFDHAYPYFKDNQASNNNINGIYVGNSYLSTTTWQAGLPYVVEHLVIGEGGRNNSGATLSLEPGVIVKFKNSYASKGLLDVYGKILAQGEASKPIVFTSFYDDEYGGDTNNDLNNSVPNKGDWLRINFYSSGSILDNAIVRYAGSEGSAPSVNFGAITVKEDENDVEFTMRNSEIRDNVYGIYINGPCEKLVNIHLENNIFSDNSHDNNCP